MCTHAHTQTSTNTSAGSCSCTTTQFTSTPINFRHSSYFYFQLLFHAFAHEGTLSIDPAAIQALLLNNGHFSWFHLWKQTAISSTLRKSMVPWVHFTNHLLFALLNTKPPHCCKKKKINKSLRHQAYLRICMHGNSCPELPKLRITRFWSKG